MAADIDVSEGRIDHHPAAALDVRERGINVVPAAMMAVPAAMGVAVVIVPVAVDLMTSLAILP